MSFVNQKTQPTRSNSSISNQPIHQDVQQFFQGLDQNRTINTDKIDISVLTIKDIAQRIQNKQLTCVEVAHFYLQNIYRYNDSVNAVVNFDSRKIFDQAILLDSEIQSGKARSFLHGIPFLVKDTYQTKDLVSTAGCEQLADYLPNENATSVQLLLDAGMLLLGKTNTSEMALDMQTNNPVYGQTNNPNHLDYGVGGSSGGCAAAIKCNMAPISICSDLAGSARLPAHFCGVFGYKASENGLSINGHIPPMPDEIHPENSLACGGIVASKTSDIHSVLQLLNQPSADARLVPLPRVDFSTQSFNTQRPLTNLSAFVLSTSQHLEVDQQIQQLLDNHQVFNSAGISTQGIDESELDLLGIWQTWGLLVGSITGYKDSSLKRFIKKHLTANSRKSSMLQNPIFDRQSLKRWFNINHQQQLLKQKFNLLMKNHDVLILPVCATTNFKHMQPFRKMGPINIYKKDISINNKPVNYWMANQAFSVIANVLGCPAISIPVGTDNNGLPIGIQVISKKYNDFELLNVVGRIVNAFEAVKNNNNDNEAKSPNVTH